jgi:hypothetical protein
LFFLSFSALDLVPICGLNQKDLKVSNDINAWGRMALPPQPKKSQRQQQSAEQQGQNSENYELNRIHGKAMRCRFGPKNSN